MAAPGDSADGASGALSGRAGACAEVFAWWAALTGLWLVLVSSVDGLELGVGVTAALLSACGARAARRAAR